MTGQVSQILWVSLVEMAGWDGGHTCRCELGRQVSMLQSYQRRKVVCANCMSAPCRLIVQLMSRRCDVDATSW